MTPQDTFYWADMAGSGKLWGV